MKSEQGVGGSLKVRGDLGTACNTKLRKDLTPLTEVGADQSRIVLSFAGFMVTVF